MGRKIALVGFLFLLVGLATIRSQAQSPTDTPTDTPTETLTPTITDTPTQTDTPTSTPTNTPNIYELATLPFPTAPTATGTPTITPTPAPAAVWVFSVDAGEALLVGQGTVNLVLGVFVVFLLLQILRTLKNR